jgi:hypothetical protein
LLAQLEQAISALPCQDKAVSSQAWHRIPDLAQEEAPPMRFLCFEKYNLQAAARRLAAYRRIRKQVFAEVVLSRGLDRRRNSHLWRSSGLENELIISTSSRHYTVWEEKLSVTIRHVPSFKAKSQAELTLSEQRERNCD